MSETVIVQRLFPEEQVEDVDPFEDDTPLSCGIDNPDYCESCQ